MDDTAQPTRIPSASTDPEMLAELERLRDFSKRTLLSMAQVDWLFAFVDELLAEPQKPPPSYIAKMREVADFMQRIAQDDASEDALAGAMRELSGRMADLTQALQKFAS